MSKNVVAITTYSNPDLLFIYLDQITLREADKDFKFRIFTEVGYDKEIDDVIEMFKGEGVDISLKVREKHKSCPLTGFHNILETYRDAAAETDEFVIVGEDDIIPVETYLEFNTCVYEDFLSKYDRIFCVGHKRRPENELVGDPYLLIGDYQMTSPSCISKKMIEKYILPHLTDDLYNDPMDYYCRVFGDSRIKPWIMTHHDGFLERVMWKNKLFGLKPDQAISGHIGLRGIHSKGMAPQGDLRERIKQYRELMKDGDKLRSLSAMPGDMVVAPDWQRHGDFEPFFLDVDRTLAEASSWHYDTENEFEKYING